MRVRVSDRALSKDLVRHLRALKYLAVEEGDAITVEPIYSVGEAEDRVRLERELTGWAQRSGVEVEISEE